jgi:hypothetical protein
MVLMMFAVAVAGCTATEPEGSSPEPTELHAGGATEALPTQPYDTLRGEELGLIDFAQRRLRDQCLADAGYPQNLEASADSQPGDAFEGLRFTVRDFGPTSEDEARRLGFGADFPGEPARIAGYDPSYGVNLERCDDQAWERFGDDAEEVYAAYLDLFNLLAPYRAELEHEVPEDLPSRMYDCLVDHDYRTDRESFLAEPSYTQFDVPLGTVEHGPEEAWEPDPNSATVQVGPAIPARRYIPTPEESALAVAWYQCLEETGRVAAFFDAAVRVQQRYVDRYETQITELNDRLEPIVRAAAELVGEP